MKPILTHVCGFGGACSRCNAPLFGPTIDGPKKLELNTPVGKVETAHGGTRVYVIQNPERDSNQKC